MVGKALQVLYLPATLFYLPKDKKLMKWPLLSLLTLLSLTPAAQANDLDFTPLGGFTINYDWMDKVINQTPTPAGSCPTVQVDVYKKGFKVARETSYYLSVSANMSRWFENISMWAAVGTGPVKDGFGIYFTTADTPSQIGDVRSKKIPATKAELDRWKVRDSAYWESFGGVSFYLGAGIAPLSANVFTVATGGWTNFLEKTGPNKVYVERAKRNIKSISFGTSASYPGISHQRVAQAAKGFSYEFTLDTDENIEAFERFMVGDTTLAQELARYEDSGVVKISDTSARKTGFTNAFGMATPYFPILSFRVSRERSYDLFEDFNSWDENTQRDHGIYVSQRRTRLFDKHLREARKFVGGLETKDLPDYAGGRNVNVETYGTFTYHYESDWGQQFRLRRYIKKLQDLTGVTQETCVNVPRLQNTLGYNQVLFEVRWSDEYLKGLMGLAESRTNLLVQLERDALRFEEQNAVATACPGDDAGMRNCSSANPSSIKAKFRNLRGLFAQMRNHLQNTDNELYAKAMAKMAETVWSSPSVFQAFFQKGKVCGMNFSYEVSGRRITRHAVSNDFLHSETSCFR